MSAFRAALLTAAAIFALPAVATADQQAAAPQHLRVDYDQSKLVRLDRPAKTVVVGNAAIADALLVSEKTVFVQGRMFGNTNIIAIDADGNEILNTGVTVGAPTVAQVTIYRGPAGQQNMACAPQCERTVTQGDKDMIPIFDNADKKVDISRKSAELSSPHR